ncbi:MAG: porin [Reichenbachiella sp.]
MKLTIFIDLLIHSILVKRNFLSLVLALLAVRSVAQTDTTETKYNLSYGGKGWHLESSDGVNTMNFELRLQFRYSYPFEQDPSTLESLSANDQHILQIRRARMKIGGTAFTTKLEYYMEYELASANLLDFWAIYSFSDAFRLQVGQYKVRYNSARVISSGKQETAERSIITKPFTVDRQIGLTIFGNLEGRGALNLSYWLGAFNGTGRGAYVDDDTKLMYQTRLQWNVFGKEMKFAGSNLVKRDEWQGHFAGGYVYNVSQFTRFSQSGGGQLEGYPEEGEFGQYRTQQYFVESAFKKNGFSWLQEYHWKEIYDQVNTTTRVLKGGYAQLGTFPQTYFDAFPEPLEIAIRYAQYRPDSNLTLTEYEYTFVTNWFFSGHRNKLTAECSWLNVKQNGQDEDGLRIRVQWEVSF